MAGIRILSVLAVLVILLVLGPSRQSVAQTPDVFTATGTMDKDAMNRQSLPVTFVVTQYTTEAERDAITSALRRSAAALHALFKTIPDVGHMEIAGRTIPLKYAYRNPANGGRTLVLVADGAVAFVDRAPGKSTEGHDFALASIDFSLPGFAAGELGEAV